MILSVIQYRNLNVCAAAEEERHETIILNTDEKEVFPLSYFPELPYKIDLPKSQYVDISFDNTKGLTLTGKNIGNEELKIVIEKDNKKYKYYLKCYVTDVFKNAEVKFYYNTVSINLNTDETPPSDYKLVYSFDGTEWYTETTFKREDIIREKGKVLAGYLFKDEITPSKYIQLCSYYYIPEIRVVNKPSIDYTMEIGDEMDSIVLNDFIEEFDGTNYNISIKETGDSISSINGKIKAVKEGITTVTYTLHDIGNDIGNDIYYDEDGTCYVNRIVYTINYIVKKPAEKEDKKDKEGKESTEEQNKEEQKNEKSSNTKNVEQNKAYSNEWVNGKWYDEQGYQNYDALLRWRHNVHGWWLEDTKGWYPVNQWVKVDGKWYYFTETGYMDYSEYRDGCWLGDDGAWIEAYKNGSWKGNDSIGWWYEDDGWCPSDKWLWIDGKCYYFKSSGYMAYSEYVGDYWLSSDGSWVK